MYPSSPLAFDRQSQEEAGQSRRIRDHLPTLFVFCAGLIVSTALLISVKQYFQHETNSYLQGTVSQRTQFLARSLDRYGEVVHSIGSFYAASNEVERAEFSAFVRPSLEKYPGIHALYWAAHVAASERKTYEAAARADGIPGFRFTERKADGELIPAAARSEYLPVYFAEQSGGTGLSLGFDLASDPATAMVLSRAADNGTIAASGRIWLEFGAERRPAMMIFFPIYLTGDVPQTVAERRTALGGFAVGLLRIDVVAEQLAEPGTLPDGGLDFYLFDESAEQDSGLLYAKTSHLPASSIEEITRESVSRGEFFAEGLEVADRRWVTVFKPTGNLHGGVGLVVPWVVFLVGLLLSSLAAHYVAWIRNRAQIIQQSVTDRTKELSAANAALNHEVQDRKNAEEALRRSEAILKDSIESISDGFALFDAEKRLVMFNERYREFDAKIADSLVPGATYDELTQAGLEQNQWPEAEGCETIWLDQQKKALDSNRLPIERRLDDGRWLLIRHQTTSDGSLVDLRTDISELKRREHDLQSSARALRSHTSDLEEIVAQRTREVRDQAERLKQALAKEKEFNSLQREFVSVVSHEFRTPITIIDGSAQRVLRSLDHATKEDLTKRMNKIRSAVKRMAGLIETTLSSTRLEAGTISMNRQSVDLAKLVADICERHREIAPSHTISVDLEELSSPIFGDPGLLDQIFTNLMSNAIKYSPDDPRVEVRGWMESDKNAVVSIADHGMGIPVDELGKMFTQFSRARTTTGFPGTGLGLYLVKQLLDMHRGTVQVESVEGEGSTFTVWLPIDLRSKGSMTTIARQPNKAPSPDSVATGASETGVF